MAEEFVGPDITGDLKPDVDITNAGDFTTIGGVTFTDAVRVGSGTGGYNTFLAISNNDGVESGFNSDDTPPIDATNHDIDQAKTHTVLLSSLVITTIAGVQYYEVRVDLNEANSDPNAQISLDQFKIYTSTNGGLESTTQLFNPANATLRYDMDAGQDISILMSDAGSTGSGTDDYSVLIPVSTFAGLDPTTTYFYLYAQMGAAGTDWTATSTFEEWNLQNGVTLTGTKFEDSNGNGIKDVGEGPVAGVTIFIDANKNGAFDAGERSTVTDANGNYSFFGIARDQTVWIDEVIPAGATQTTGDHETVLISANAAAGSTIVVDPIGNFIPHPSMNVTKAVSSITGGVVGGADSAGDVINYGISVQNTGNVALTGLTITDPNANVGSIQPVTSGGFNTGDTDHDNVFDAGETWNYTAAHTVTQAELDGKGIDIAGAIDGDGDDDNRVTADTNETAPDTADAAAPLLYNPGIDLEKYVSVDSTNGTNGTFVDADDALGPQNVNLGADVWFHVTVQNTGNITLTDVDIADVNQTGGGSVNFDLMQNGALTADATANHSATLAGDTDNDGQLDVGETWTITYRQAFDPGEHVNTATVTTHEGQTDNDAAHYFSLVDEGLCPRTPGFWQNPKNGGQFWDGIQGNEKHAGEAGFPDGELLYAVDSNHDGVINGSDQKGLLIGDYDHDGTSKGADGILGTADDEDVLFVSYADAQSLINASTKQLNGQSGDGKFMLGRDMVASWLNYLQGSGFGDASDPQSPHHYLDDAIDWMQIYSGTNSGGTTETFDVFKLAGAAIKTSTAIWNTPQSGIDHSAGQMHSALDYYNNTGQTQVGGTHYANCESQHLFEALSIYQEAHSII